MTEPKTVKHIPGVYPLALCFCGLLFALSLPDASHWLPGMNTILHAEGALITDYLALVGPGPAFLNSALVTLCTLLVFRLAKVEPVGSNIFVLGLMSGFSLFGKNIFNMWPFVFGSYLYARFKKEPFSQHCNIGLLSSCLGPIVSFLCWSGGPLQFALGLLLGVVIGFVICPLSCSTLQILTGLNLYHGGFACGLTAFVVVPVLTALGKVPSGGLWWSTQYTYELAVVLGILCLAFLLLGTFFAGTPKESWAAYSRLLKDPGRAPCDFLHDYGPGAVLINMGLCGWIGTGYILLIGGALNGPTVGSIFTVMGFAAYGKHPRNILPVMGGIALGALLLPELSLTAPAVQMAVFLGTTLAPMSGTFGWWGGLLAGFLHICLVQRTGGPVNALNLYNNGFSGGLVAIFLTPILSQLPWVKEKR
ncbi:MAG: DUF1576 domain-containing protein [Oscillospiraceae bacterium]|nr:DUF1576 domain-containing protein [Oscillospiraceae bacterium]